MSLATISGADFVALFPPYAAFTVGWRPPLIPRDTLYAMPTLDWLLGEYRTYIRAEMERLGLINWSEGDHDCDDYASFYQVHAQICKGRMRLGDGLALAVAYIEYYRSSAQPNGWHAICAAAVEGKRLVYIEPAYEYGCDVIELSEEEQKSVRLIII